MLHKNKTGATHHSSMLLFVFVIFCYMDKIYCACNMGPNNVASYIASLPSSTGEQVITADTSMDAGCCGLLDRIQFYPRGTGYVQFQFWRPLAANEYTLITEYRYYVPIRDTTWTIYFPADVYLQTGDFIGWYTESTGVIAYGSGSYDRNIVVSIGDVAEGYNFSLSTPYINNRIYAIKYYISNGNKADFTNLPASIDAYDDTPVGSLLYTISYTDLDVEDVSTLVLTLRSITPSTANVAVDIATGKVTTTGPLTFGTIYVDMRVHDRCNLGNERILTINVINYSPVIGNLPASCDLSEIVTIETFLYEVTVSDASGDAVTCAINNTSPAGAPFLLKFISGTTSYGIYSQSSPSLDYSTTSLYTLAIQCTDGMTADEETFTVHVTQNSPAVFSNLPENVTLPLTTPRGTVVYTVQAVDPEGSSVGYSSVGCHSCWFTVASSGEVVVNTYLLTKTSTTYDVRIRANDGIVDSSTSTLTFIFTGINSAPTLGNLPRTLNIPESLAVGSEVVTILMTDPDVTDTHTYIFSYNPSSAASAFSFDTTSRRVTVASPLNYESGVIQYTISFTVDDGHLSDGPKDLIINILDVNEAPVFQKAIYSTAYIERGINYALPDPGFVVTDDDIGDTVSYSITSGNSLGRFFMNSTTGIISYMVNYDVDNGNMPEFVDLVVTATDSDGLTATTLLQVTIVDNNDNGPVFEQNSYETTITSELAIGSSVIQVIATDADLEYYYNNIVYTLYSGSTEYFGIKDNGEIYLVKSVSLYGNNTELDIVIRATSPGRNTDVPVKVIVVPPSSDDFFDDSGNVAWFSICIIIGVVGVVISCVLLYRYFRYGYICAKKTAETSVEHINMKNADSTTSGISNEQQINSAREVLRDI